MPAIDLFNNHQIYVTLCTVNILDIQCLGYTTSLDRTILKVHSLSLPFLVDPSSGQACAQGEREGPSSGLQEHIRAEMASFATPCEKQPDGHVKTCSIGK